MISPNNISEAFNRNVQIIKLQTEGLSHDESLEQLPFRANCMNWIIGHLVTNRVSVLRLLGAEISLESTGVSRYDRESEPITQDGDGVITLEQLLILLEELQSQIASRLSVVDLEDLDKQTAFFGRRSMSIGEWLLFFYFHDTYHTGQAEILRQAAGKNDKII